MGLPCPPSKAVPVEAETAEVATKAADTEAEASAAYAALLEASSLGFALTQGRGSVVACCPT